MSLLNGGGFLSLHILWEKSLSHPTIAPCHVWKLWSDCSLLFRFKIFLFVKFFPFLVVIVVGAFSMGINLIKSTKLTFLAQRFSLPCFGRRLRFFTHLFYSCVCINVEEKLKDLNESRWVFSRFYFSGTIFGSGESGRTTQ